MFSLNILGLPGHQTSKFLFFIFLKVNVFWLFNFSITLTAGCWNKTKIARNHQTWDELPLTLVTFLSGHVQKQRKPASVKHNHSSRVWVRSSTSKVWWMWESCHCGAFQDCSEHTWLDVINEAAVCWTHTHTHTAVAGKLNTAGI